MKEEDEGLSSECPVFESSTYNLFTLYPMILSGIGPGAHGRVHDPMNGSLYRTVNASGDSNLIGI